MLQLCTRSSKRGVNLKNARFARHFYDLLDCLAGQFFTERAARCAGNEFGTGISLNAKEYFSIAIIPEELPHDQVVLGVLVDDSAHVPSRNGFTFVIYIDPSKIEGAAFKIFSIIILAHEICHFAFYYELFIKLGDNTGIAKHSDFTHTVCGKLIGAVTEEQDSTSQTIFDEHNIRELIRNLRKYPKKHFAKGKETKIDYQGFLNDFLSHLDLEEKMNEYRNKP